MTFSEAYNSNSMVYHCVRRSVEAKEIVGVLAARIEALQARIIELESICPKLHRTDDGKLLRWDCPTELLPRP